MEKSFANITFRGSFRDYQRNLLHRLEDRLDENRLHIVTPPGSGKIVIGLELLRRIGDPCLILSTTETSRLQWFEGFTRHFLPDSHAAERETYLSSDLMQPSLLTSATYETLYSLVKKGEASDGGKTVGLGDTDIIRLVQERGVRTVLLDEPHHLPPRYTDALASFIGVLGGEVRVVTMTAYAPYDLHSDEWDHYVGLCGEVTEEIPVPELVKSGILCPHQDYVYFNYPTEAETEGMRGYRTRADEAVAEALTLPFMGELNHRLSRLFRRKFDYLISHHQSIVALLELLHEYGQSINVKVYKGLTGKKEFRPATLENAQHAMNFLLESQTILRDGEKEQLKKVFAEHRVLEDDRIHLYMTHKLRNTLTSSVGKLGSISAITVSEGQSQGEQLREIILTDPLHKEDLALFGQDQAPTLVGMPTVFDTLRHSCPLLPIGCLVEGLAVLPCSAEHALVQKCGLEPQKLTVKPIGLTQYGFFAYSETALLIQGVSTLFRDGYIRVLIGSADSLGHGWDDSFVNTLILASFHGSEVALNHVRGRVIHADRQTPEKVAHIWHLVTVEHAYSTQQNINLRLASRLTAELSGGLAGEYRSMSHRFECYMGPDEKTGDLENGINRLRIGELSSEDRLNEINNDMLRRSSSRTALRDLWKTVTREDTSPIAEVRVPAAAKVPVFTPFNTVFLLLAIAIVSSAVLLFAFFFYTILYYIIKGSMILPLVMVALVSLEVLLALGCIWGIVFLIYMAPLVVSHAIPSRSIRTLCRALFKTLKVIGEISDEAVLVMQPLRETKGYSLYLADCSRDEQMLFQKAVAEMLSAVRTPRYLMVRAGWFRRLLWRWSFACPMVIAKNDISVKTFEKYIRRSMGRMKFQYTRRDPGRKYLIFSHNHSYLNTLGVTSERRLHLFKHDPVV